MFPKNKVNRCKNLSKNGHIVTEYDLPLIVSLWHRANIAPNSVNIATTLPQNLQQTSINKIITQIRYALSRLQLYPDNPPVQPHPICTRSYRKLLNHALPPPKYTVLQIMSVNRRPVVLFTDRVPAVWGGGSAPLSAEPPDRCSLGNGVW